MRKTVLLLAKHIGSPLAAEVRQKSDAKKFIVATESGSCTKW
jgi:hypothetical protein